MYYTKLENSGELYDYVIPCNACKCPKCGYETVSFKHKQCTKCKVNFDIVHIHYKYFNEQLYKVSMKDDKEVYQDVTELFNGQPCPKKSKTHGTIKICNYFAHLRENDEFYYNNRLIFIKGHNSKPQIEKKKNSEKNSEQKNSEKKPEVEKNSEKKPENIIDKASIVTFSKSAKAKPELIDPWSIKFNINVFDEFIKINGSITSDEDDNDKFREDLDRHSIYSVLNVLISFLETDFAKSIAEFDDDDEYDDESDLAYLHFMGEIAQKIILAAKHYDKIYQTCRLLTELGMTVDKLSKEDVRRISNSKCDVSKFMNYQIPWTYSNTKEIIQAVKKCVF
jgi:hypothetical protein